MKSAATPGRGRIGFADGFEGIIRLDLFVSNAQLLKASLHRRPVKYLLLTLISIPMIALAGREYAVEIVCLVAMAAGALKFLQYLDGDDASALSDGAN